MIRKNLQHIKLDHQKSEVEGQNPLNTTETTTDVFVTAEGISVKKTYSEKDIENCEHLDFGAGFAPYLRGSYSTMYVNQPWIMRQYSGFSSALESNSFFKQSIALGQKELFLAFNLPAHHDSDYNEVIGNSSKAAITIDSVEDMKIVFDQIPLDKISVSMSVNRGVLPIMAFFIVAAEEKGIPLETLSGTLQNDILKEFTNRNTSIYPPEKSLRIVADILKFTTKKMPKFNSISISGYPVQEAGGTADMELAYTFADGLEYVRTALAAGLKIDEFAPRLSFFWGIGMNHFMEIAKLRAGRLIWAKLVQQFHPKDEKSLILKAHCHTSVSSLTLQDPFNNVTRTTIEAAAAVFGGTQSLHTNALDEALGLSKNFSTRIARNTQLFLQEETKITQTVDPWAGSFYIESLTHELLQNTWKRIEEIEELGGMTKAIASGIPQLRIKEAAAKKQNRMDSDQDSIIGRNKYPLEKEDPVQILEVDNQILRPQEIEQFEKIKIVRDSKKVQMALEKITLCAKNGEGNLLDFTIEAARNRATLGEINSALETVFG